MNVVVRQRTIQWAMWPWMLGRLQRDIAYVKTRGFHRAELGTGSRRSSGPRSNVDNDNTDHSQLRVLTLNVWGLFALPHIEYRVEAISSRLEQYDVVAFQEVWHCRERDLLREAGLRAGLNFSHYFASGVGIPFYPGSHGTGLLVLSRFCITNVDWKRFSVNGKPYKIQHSDYLTGRGIGLVRLLLKSGPVDIYTTHLHACYVDDPEIGEYHSHRVTQAFESAQFIRATARSPLIILLGDFNCWQRSVPMNVLKNFVNLKDAWDSCNLAPTDPSELLAFNLASCTYGCENNKFSFVRGVKPQRLDYVMFLTLASPLAPDAHWQIRNCSVVAEFMEDPSIRPGSKIPLSDHWGVQANFCIDESKRSSASSTDLSWPIDFMEREQWELLQTTLAVVTQGRQEAVDRRHSHHRRMFICIFFSILVWISGIGLSFPLTLFPYVASGYIVIELLLAQIVVTDEIMSFTEVLQQMRHHVRRYERGHLMTST